MKPALTLLSCLVLAPALKISHDQNGGFDDSYKRDMAFSRFDSNGNGYIDLEQFASLGKSGNNGKNLDQNQLQAFYDTVLCNFDNGDGQIDKDEFFQFLNNSNNLNQDCSNKAAQKSFFRKADSDGDGLVSRDELRNFVVSMTPSDKAQSEQQMNKDLDQVYATVDGDQDGGLNSDEFGQFVSISMGGQSAQGQNQYHFRLIMYKDP